jgi:hypothetical protein
VTPHEVYLVVNAGCRDKDLEHIGKHLAAAKVGTQASAAAAAAEQAETETKAVEAAIAAPAADVAVPTVKSQAWRC